MLFPINNLSMWGIKVLLILLKKEKKSAVFATHISVTYLNNFIIKWFQWNENWIEYSKSFSIKMHWNDSSMWWNLT